MGRIHLLIAGILTVALLCFIYANRHGINEGPIITGLLFAVGILVFTVAGVTIIVRGPVLDRLEKLEKRLEKMEEANRRRQG